MLFENGHKRFDPSKIESFNPKTDKIAQTIDLEKYLVMDNFGPAAPKPLKNLDTDNKPRERHDPPDASDYAIFKFLSETPTYHKYHHLMNEFRAETFAPRHFE